MQNAPGFKNAVFLHSVPFNKCVAYSHFIFQDFEDCITKSWSLQAPRKSVPAIAIKMFCFVKQEIVIITSTSTCNVPFLLQVKHRRRSSI